MRLSISMIVKNEEVMLSRCLESVKDADEIVIVDTGSVDKTIEVASKYTDKIHHFKWIDDFSAARNFALSKCTGDWIISIDADEYFEPGAIDSIRKLVESTSADSLYVKLKSNFHSDFFYLIKVFRSYMRYEGAIHEAISSYNSIKSEIVLFCESSPSHAFDPKRNMRILTVETAKNPSARNLYYLAREYWYLNQHDEAIMIFEKCIQKSTWPPERADAYLYLARCYWLTYKGDMARDRCMNAILINPDFKEALLFMSEIVWPHHSDRWKSFAEQATNKEVLFIRKS